MSAFIVGNGTMNRVVNALDKDRNLSCQELDELGRKLFEMNARAVDARYGRCSVATDYRVRVRSYPKFELVKALDCLIYQCSEGDVPKEPLYQDLVTVRNRMVREMVCADPAYEAAPWDAA